MLIKSRKDFLCGLMFLVSGVAFAWGATSYSLGEAGRMGPGYFPLMLGIVLAVIGAIVTLTSFVVGANDGEPLGAIAWKPLIFIISANVIFGVLLGGIESFGIPAFGLVASIYALTFVAALAGDEFRFKEVLILATVLASGSYIAFVVVLKLPFPIWPTFITG